MPKVYIAVYRPRDGNYYHWALYVKSTPSKIFEVTGSHPNFERNIVQAKPESTNRHVENIEVGDVSEGDMSEFYSIMRRVEVDNETVDWNCQDYVVEALEALVEECVIDEDDEDYKKGIRKAKKKYYGPQ
ncbi:hypothetical protein Q7P37_009815 [Cladosporium fusiforme]